MNHLHSADQMVVKKINTSLILNCLRYQESLTRAQLATQTGLNRSTVTNLVDDLMKQHLIIETGIQASSGGRPGIELSLNPHAGASIGIEFKDTFVTVVLTDFIAKIIWRKKIQFTNRTLRVDFEALYPKIEALVEEALHSAAEHDMRVLGLGIALPGPVNVGEGVSIHAPNLGWRNLPIRKIFAERFQLPVFVGNGAALSALSERHYGAYGASSKAQNMIYISTSHIGIGGGIFLNNQLYHGVSGYAGEIGHVVVNPDGDRCGCGRVGCWETEVGELNLTRRIQKRLEAGEESLTSRMLADSPDDIITIPMLLIAADQQDAVAQEALERLYQMLALGIANLVNIFNPQMIVLGGSFSQLPESAIETVREIVNQEALSSNTSQLEIIAGKLPREDVCVMGAATLVLDDVLQLPVFNGIR